jgi:uncharacterized HAD superfamily protein
LRIGIDMDGVLCDFNQSLVRFIRSSFNEAIPDVSDEFPAEWNYFRSYVTPREEQFMWEQVESSGAEFWRNLSPISGAIPSLFRLSRGVNDLYFITTRGGRTAKRQSELWLTERAKIAFPTVLIADSPEAKGKLCGALKLDWFVDDRPENCDFAYEESEARVFIVDRPYNRHFIGEYVERVDSFESFVLRVEEEKR